MDEAASSSSLKVNSSKKVDGRGSKAEVANHDDLEQMDRREVQSHDADQDGREGEQMDAEGSSGEVAVEDDLAQEDWRQELSHANEQSGREGEQSPVGQSCLKSISNLALEVGRPRLSTNGGINSATRTKTVSFNQKGDT